MVTTFVRPLPTGESYILVGITVNARFRVKGSVLVNELKELILENYSYSKSEINKTTRISDMYALIDNHPKVDFLNIDYIKLKPYIKPINHLLQLNYNLEIKESNNSNNWKIKFDGLYFKIFKNRQPIADIMLGQTYSDNIIEITINNSPYENGMEWEFKTISNNGDLLINDFSVPIITEENLNLNIIERLIP
jgi:hypothetical protein